MDLKFIRTLEMRTIETGGEQAAATMDKLAASHQKVAGAAVASSTSTERAAKSQKSLRDSVEALEKRFDPLIRAQTEFEKVERRMLAAGAAFPEQRERANAVIAKAAQHYDALAQSASASGKVVVDNTKAAVDALGKLERQFSPLMRASQDFENVKKQMATVVTADPQLQTRANAVIAQARQEYEKVAASVKDVATNTDLAAASVGKYERQFSPVIRARQEFEAVTKEMKAAAAADPKLQERANVVIAQAKQEYEKVAIAANNAGKAAIGSGQGMTSSAEGARLARHELINLSRQFQDVGVSLASGQSPLTVLVQQGSQIADVFATSTGTIRGFFGQVASGAARFIASAAGIASSAAAVGAGFLLSAGSFASGQRDIERALIGIGRASGVTRDQINEIGEATKSSFGLSGSQARETATAFAATGKIYQENVGLATRAIDLFVQAGADAEDTTKMLAKALLDPSKGAIELNQKYNFLNATLLENIRVMQAQGNLQGAQKAVIEAITPKLKESADQVGVWTRAWVFAKNTMSDTLDVMQKMDAQLLQSVTGKDMGAVSLEDQLKSAQERLATIRAPRPRMAPFAPVELTKPIDEAAAKEVERLTKAIEDAGKAREQARLDLLSTEAKLIADSVIPATAAIQTMTEQLNKLRDARLAASGPVTGAETVLNVQLQQEKEKEASLIRQAQAAQDLQAKYLGISFAGATLLQQAQNQLTLAQAQTGHEAIIAQEKIRQKDAALAQLPIAERLRIAAEERKVAEANVTKSLNDQIKGLEDELKLIEARANGSEAAAKAEIAYRKAIEAGGPGAVGKAQQIAGLTERVEAAREEEQASNKVAENAKNVGDVFAVAVDNWNSMEQSSGKMLGDAERILDAFESETFRRAAMSMTEQLDESFAVGGKSQFTGSYGGSTPGTEFITAGMKAMFERFGGQGNVSAVAGGPGGNLYSPTKAGIASAQSFDLRKLESAEFGTRVARSDQYSTKFESGGSMGLSNDLLTAFNSAIMIAKGVSDQNAGYLQRLVNLAPEEQKGSMLQQMIAQVQMQPSTLAREELLKSLNDQLKALTDASKSLEDTMKLQLDPLFSQGHDYINKLKIGYYQAATGLTGIVGGSGSGDVTPVHMMLEPGELLKVIPKGSWTASDLYDTRTGDASGMGTMSDPIYAAGGLGRVITGTVVNPDDYFPTSATTSTVPTADNPWAKGDGYAPPNNLPVTQANDNSKVVNNYNTFTFAAGATDTPTKRWTAKQFAQGFARGATQAAMQ